eukprot:GHVU01048202.1.p1 GENE.GHVU01048202.1~~GHVU01048202.1.p1  ORF type:complete len:101 (+),score=0.38 GHVU01048202.1:385-687(+)
MGFVATVPVMSTVLRLGNRHVAVLKGADETAEAATCVPDSSLKRRYTPEVAAGRIATCHISVAVQLLYSCCNTNHCSCRSEYMQVVRSPCHISHHTTRNR